jgi:hypothetical protein
LPPPSLASPLKSDSILPLGDSESLTVNVSIFRRYVSSSRSRRAHHRSSAASTYTLLRALSFSRTVEPAHPLRIALAHARLHLGRLARGVTEVAETLQATVTRRLDEPTMMLGDLRVNQLSPDRL